MRYEGARVLSTRARLGMTVRRYELPTGHRETTVELPYSVLGELGAAKLGKILDRHQRGVEQRARTHQRRQRITELLGPQLENKPTAVAHEVGVSEAYVRQVRAALRKKHDQK